MQENATTKPLVMTADWWQGTIYALEPDRKRLCYWAGSVVTKIFLIIHWQ
jgi:hypothetical protein